MCEHGIDSGLQFLSSHQHHQHFLVPGLSVVSTLCGIIEGFVEIIGAHGGFAASVAEQSGESSETTSGKTVTFAEKPERDGPTRRMSFIQRSPSQLLTLLGKIFVFAYAWSFAGTLDSQSIEDNDEEKLTPGECHTPIRLFDTFLRDLFENDSPTGVTFPAGNDSILNYYIDMQSGQFAQWTNLVPTTRALIAKAVSNQFAISDTLNTLDDPPPLKNDTEADRLLIPTVDTVRYAFLIALLALNGQPVLLTGQSGVGKSTLIHDTLERLSRVGGTGTGSGTILGAVFRTGGKDLVDSIIETTSRAGDGHAELESEVVFTSVHFSAYTTPAKVRAFIETKLVKRGRDVLGPIPGKKVCV